MVITLAYTLSTGCDGDEKIYEKGKRGPTNKFIRDEKAEGERIRAPTTKKAMSSIESFPSSCCHTLSTEKVTSDQSKTSEQTVVMTAAT
jgi:hypothetical protein